MRTQIDIKRLRYIVEIARCESITTAAETLSLTQPALTRSVAEVENELGTKLFHRLPRGVQLTETGERFVQRARQVISDVDDLVTDIRDATTALSGRLRIGVAPAGYVNYLLPELTTIAQDHPEVRVETISGSAQSLCPRLLRGELNLMIGPSSYLNRWKELHIQELRKLHFGALMRKDHPLRDKKNLSEVDVLEYPLILPSSLTPPQPRYATDSFEAVRALIKDSDTWFPMHYPSQHAAEELKSEFWVLEDVVKLPQHTVSIAHAAQQPMSPEAELFESLILERHGIAA